MGGDFENRTVVVPQVFSIPPFEEHLMQSTLWPEVHKIYGHGNALFCLTSNYKGNLIASACKGMKTPECTILIHETKNWKETAVLTSHSKTITQLQFSHSDKYLLSVSRDRAISVFVQEEEGVMEYKRNGKLIN